jgi:tetratricopeptide (TPR) repeat protein
MDWEAKRVWAIGEHDRRAAMPTVDGERDDFRLAGIAGASWAAGLACAMLGRLDEAGTWLRLAADEYATSWHAAPAGSWGRPIAILRCRLLADDTEGARADASAALEAGAAAASGPIGGYCAALALLVLGRDAEAAPIAERIADEGLEPVAVAHALAALAAHDLERYDAARREVLRSFEARDAFLEDVHVADTVLVLDALARERGIEDPPLDSPLLPA